ncbi:alpha/beta hydrolase [Rhizobium laguerreae]|uniref:alpha/beta hydrolase n=1 Tax=Rhizobium laguerreae TaxID=1076926 RepID=UPI001440EBCD|nr:alpha/beta hydrolase [Rhizobium laguerreae]MBY3321354.1 alpha/beta hydrolase [Rhizobium laguerreae]MBY3362948.1 alpha/beta hydrolase [Rhizobium laguerreae]NKM66509.1 alpha/beta hydrolase fold domain-containing protein [Rhizobium laguerreae]
MKDDLRGIRLAAKTLPFPTSISDEAQAVLRSLVNDDGVPVNSLYVMPSVDDPGAWRTVQAAVRRNYETKADMIEPTLRSTATTVVVDKTTVHCATPEGLEASGDAVIDLHGGAFTFGGGRACRVSAQSHADRLSAFCYGVDYRMPPDHPYPAALDDCLEAYSYVLRRHDPSKIVILGRSAGGNLAAATLLRARDEKLPMPAALVLLSPEVDLTESGDSFEQNRMSDVVLPGSLMSNNRLYAGGADLAHPYLSPLFGDLSGFPPTFLQSGTRDLFLSNTVRMHRALRAAGTPAELHVFEAMPHGGFMGQTPEDEELFREVGAFIRRFIGETVG